MGVGENAYSDIFYAVRGTNNRVIHFVPGERVLLENVAQQKRTICIKTIL